MWRGGLEVYQIVTQQYQIFCYFYWFLASREPDVGRVKVHEEGRRVRSGGRLPCRADRLLSDSGRKARSGDSMVGTLR